MLNSRISQSIRRCSANKRAPSVRVYATSYQQIQERKVHLKKRIFDAIDHASDICHSEPTSKSCLLAMEVVEELTKAYHDVHLKFPDNTDVLEMFCKEEPSDIQCKEFDI